MKTRIYAAPAVKGLTYVSRVLTVPLMAQYHTVLRAATMETIQTSINPLTGGTRAQTITVRLTHVVPLSTGVVIFCKAKRQYLLIRRVSRYFLLALHGSVSAVVLLHRGAKTNSSKGLLFK